MRLRLYRLFRFSQPQNRFRYPSPVRPAGPASHKTSHLGRIVTRQSEKIRCTSLADSTPAAVRIPGPRPSESVGGGGNGSW
jgi:hypothetical protein